MRLKYNLLRAMLLYSCSAAALAEGSGANEDLFEVDLESLMQMQVTSVAKKAQEVIEAPAAVYVITQKEIQRSGITSIPEALRLAPGIQVSRIDSNKWAITSRGFAGRFSNKLLVLIDGRSVYTPLFSGVYWEVQDLLIDDIDRIEVIRGPGAALWGANAVNGIINIISKPAQNAQGGLATFYAGNQKNGAAYRYGASLGNDGFYRAYAKYRHYGEFEQLGGGDNRDGWRLGQMGWRIDRVLKAGDRWKIQGDLYKGYIDQLTKVPTTTSPFSETLREDIAVDGGNLLTKWTRTQEQQTYEFQFYYDYTKRDDVILTERRWTADISLQHQWRFTACHDLIWGLGTRVTEDRTEAGPASSLQPDGESTNMYNGFIQYEHLFSDALNLVLGNKFEKHDYTGLENQPTVRMIWRTSPESAWWVAASKASRTPSRGERDVSADVATIPPGTPDNPGPVPVLFRLLGNHDMKPGSLSAYELGYKALIDDWFSVDLALFYNEYTDLESLQLGVLQCSTEGAVFPFCPPADIWVQPSFIASVNTARSHGGEIVFGWKVSEFWDVKAVYSYIDVDFGNESTGGMAGPFSSEGNTPQHQLSIRNFFRLTDKVSLNTWLRYQSELPGIPLDEYFDIDISLNVRFKPNVMVSLVGHNLVDSRHPEFSEQLFSPTVSEVPRSFYVGLEWRF